MRSQKEEIIDFLKKKTKLEEVPLEVPKDTGMGEFAFPCFVLSKKLKKSPADIAKDLAKENPPDGVEKIEAAGPYLNFFLDSAVLAEQVLKKIFKDKDCYGLKPKTKKTVLIEYPGPNTNKPLHLGHVRNIVLGSSMVKLKEAVGDTVFPVNVNNDRGIHICKSMLAFKKFGKDDSPERSKLKSDHFVGKYYVKFAQEVEKNPDFEKEAQELLDKWEQGDKETLDLWKKMNKWAFDGFKETYKRFGIKFKKEYFESETYKQGKEIVMKGVKDGLFQKDDSGAIIVNLEKQGLDKKVLLRANGTSVYITQDIFLAKSKYDDFKYDESVYVVANEQNYHFKVLFNILKILNFPFADNCYHFAYGMVNLTSGKMKSREGTVVDADNLVDEMKSLAREETKKRHKGISENELEIRSEEIALAAIRFYLLKHDAAKDMLFDPEESLSFEGETGPYVQYAHARCCSLLKKHGKKVGDKVDFSKFEGSEELVTLLGNYGAVVEGAVKHYDPSLLAHYLLSVAQKFSKFYNSSPILSDDKELTDYRVLLVDCTKQVIKNGLSLLCIDALEVM